LVTHGTPTVAGAVALGLTGTYLTINNLKQEAAEEAAEKAAQKADSGSDTVNEEQDHAH
jgi:hypothetical protein